MSKNVFKIGIDIGNKNLKVCGEAGFPHEIPVAYEEIKEDEYYRETTGTETEKVFYNGKYYFVGLQCNRGLPQNKGSKSVREVANMFKLVGIAREMRRVGVNNNKGEFYVVTGTPVEDYDAYVQDYIDLMKTPGSDYEKIELNGVEYQIKVLDVDVTKQSACVAPTIPNWKESEFILVDFGGGTLDVAHFKNGVRIMYRTLGFPLNEALSELRNELNIYGLGLPRANALDSGFIKIMEDVVMEGKYRNVTTIQVGEEKKDLKEFSNMWLQNKVDTIIEDIKIRLNLSETDSKSIPVYYIGGGAKLLNEILTKNTGFANKKIIDPPHFVNVNIYHAIANNKNWSNKTEVEVM